MKVWMDTGTAYQRGDEALYRQAEKERQEQEKKAREEQMRRAREVSFPAYAGGTGMLGRGYSPQIQAIADQTDAAREALAILQRNLQKNKGVGGSGPSYPVPAFLSGNGSFHPMTWNANLSLNGAAGGLDQGLYAGGDKTLYGDKPGMLAGMDERDPSVYRDAILNWPGKTPASTFSSGHSPNVVLLSRSSASDASYQNGGYTQQQKQNAQRELDSLRGTQHELYSIADLIKRKSAGAILSPDQDRRLQTYNIAFSTPAEPNGLNTVNQSLQKLSDSIRNEYAIINGANTADYEEIQNVLSEKAKADEPFEEAQAAFDMAMEPINTRTDEIYAQMDAIDKQLSDPMNVEQAALYGKRNDLQNELQELKTSADQERTRYQANIASIRNAQSQKEIPWYKSGQTSTPRMPAGMPPFMQDLWSQSINKGRIKMETRTATQNLEEAKSQLEVVKKSREPGKNEAQKFLENKISDLQEELKGMGYYAYRFNGDFDSLAKKGEEASKDLPFGIEFTISDDTAINNIGYIHQSNRERTKYATSATIENDYLYFISDEERKTYNYTKEKYGRGAAEEYIKYIRPMLESRATQTHVENTREYTEKANQGTDWDKIAAFLKSNLYTLFKPRGYVYALEQWIKGEDINPNAVSFEPNLNQQAIREVQRDSISHPAWKFLYDVGASTSDFLLIAPLGPAVTSMVLSTGAASDRAHELALQGASSTEIVLLSTATGLTELITEKVGAERLWGFIGKGQSHGWKELASSVIRGGLSEGTEEIPGVLVDFIADRIVRQDQSAFVADRDKLIADGYTKAEAEAILYNGLLQEATIAFLMGTASGTALNMTFAGAGKAKQAFTQADIPFFQAKAEGKDIGVMPWGKNGVQASTEDASLLGTTESAAELPPKDAVKVGESAEAPPLILKAGSAGQGDVILEPDTSAQAQPQPEKTTKAAATVQGADGKASSVTVVGIADIQNGDMMLSLSDGTTRPATEVAFAEKVTKDLYDMAKVYGNAQTANTFLKTYDLVGGDTETFQKAFYRYYEAGLTGTKPEKPGVNVKAAMLSPEVQKMALDAGKKMGKGEEGYGDRENSVLQIETALRDKYGEHGLEISEQMLKNKQEDEIEYRKYLDVLGENSFIKNFQAFQHAKYVTPELFSFVKLDYDRRMQLIDNPSLVLPNVEHATAAEQKFVEYIFNPKSEDGWPKGVAFERRLGYNIFNYLELKMEILQQAPYYPARFVDSSIYGDRYEQKIVLYGKKGRPANVVIGWMVNGDKVWLTAPMIKEVKKDEANSRI